MDEAERTFGAFKPVTYDVQAHVKAIEAFEVKAVRGPTWPGACTDVLCGVAGREGAGDVAEDRRRTQGLAGHAPEH